jgi:nucleoside-diphosphate-sugar epimerase
VQPLRLVGDARLKSCRWACRLTAMAEDLTHSTAGHRGLITVFGGTGFLGRRIVRHLLDHRFQVRAASRHPERVGSASQADAGPGTTKADIRDETTVAAALFGAYGAVNAVSLYVERGRETFDAVHVEAAARVARLARENGVERLIHVSGIGADPASALPPLAAGERDPNDALHSACATSRACSTPTLC